MDDLNEKKWFIYLGDHHEGPFSLTEIGAKLSRNDVTTGHFIWADGMPDWKMMTEVPAFHAILHPPAAPPPPPSPLSFHEESSPSITLQMPTKSQASADAVAVARPSMVKAAPSDSSPSEFTMPVVTLQPSDDAYSPSDISKSIIIEPDREAVAKPKAKAQGPALPTKNDEIRLVAQKKVGQHPQTRSGEPDEDDEIERRAKKKRTARWALLAMILGGIPGAYFSGFLDPLMRSSPGAGRNTLAQLSDKIPFLSQWFSPIPNLDDLPPEDLGELKSVAGSKLDSGGPRLALALSKADVFSPSFYVASNLPDGATLDIYVEGVQDTLLAQEPVLAKLTVTLTKKLGKTSPAKMPDGKPLPRGQYMIYVTESPTQPPTVQGILSTVPTVANHSTASLPKDYKLLVKQTYFLGGIKDAIYTSRLKELHDKIREKANAELAEVKQFSATLESQLNSTLARFTLLQKGKVTPMQKRTWDGFHNQWMALSNQLDQTFSKWTPETLKKDYFYGVLYQVTLQTSQAIAKVHALHHAYFTTPTDPKTFSIQLGEATSLAQNAVNALKAKIDQAEKIPPSPNGMPRTEGL